APLTSPSHPAVVVLLQAPKQRSPPLPYTTLFRSPGAPGRRPRRENVEFFSLPAQAEAAGYRASRRSGEPTPGERDQRALLIARRSEEHTSELQSRENLVCRLLLEKKNSAHKTG